MWMDEDDAHLDEQDVRDLVEKFNVMIKESDSVYFDVDQLEVIIEHYLEQGLPEKAKSAVEHGLVLFSRNDFLLLRKAQILITLGELEEAKQVFKSLLMADSQNSEILFGLGMIEAQEQFPKKAVTYYKLAFDNADPEFKAEILIELALQYQFIDEPDKSLACYKKALGLGFNLKTTLREINSCVERFKKLVEGTAVVEDFVDKNPYSITGWFYLGGLYSMAGAVKKALDCYEYSIIIKEENPDAYFKKAECLMKLEKYDLALVEFKNELKYREPIAFNYCMIADCYEQIGDFLAAEDYYNKALSLDESYSEAYLGLGFLKELKFESAAAESYYRKAIQTDFKSINAHLLLSNLMCTNERYDDAITLIQDYLSEEKGIEEMWLELGNIYSKSGEYQNALDTVNRGIENALSNEKLWLKKVVYLHKNGAVKEALELMRELLEEDKTIGSTVKDFCASLLDDSNFSSLINQYT